MMKVKFDNLLVYLVGLFSTLQIMTIAGTNLFTILCLLYCLYRMLGKFKLHFEKEVLAFVICILLSLLANQFVTQLYIRNVDEWKKVCISSSVVFVIVFLFYCLINKSEEKCNLFVKGLYHSCIIQVIWAYLQLLFTVILHVDLNDMVFVRWLGMWTSLDSSNVFGQLNLTGMNLNAGIMGPVILIAFLINKNTLQRVLIFSLFFLTGNTTTFIMGVFTFCILMYESVRHTKALKRKVLIYLVIIILLGAMCVATQPELVNRFLSIFENLSTRFNSIKTQNWLEGSTFVHYRYYQSLPYIFSRIGILRILIGFGFRCGGMPFVVYFQQYPDATYGTESDPISMLYGIGFIGLISLYFILFELLVKGKKIGSNYYVFVLVIIIGGLFYSLQLNWLLLFEFIALSYIKKRIDIFNIKEAENEFRIKKKIGIVKS